MKGEEPDKPENDTTTVRATVTRDEHNALHHICKHRLAGMTIDQFVRNAISKELHVTTGKSWEQLAAESKDRGKAVQLELF